jgi:hypothetical protein
MVIFSSYAQPITQNIRGTVVDMVTQSPLPGASIVIADASTFTGTTTDGEGNFILPKVPIGKHTLKVTFLGYKERMMPNVIVNSGKETILTIPLEEIIIEGKEVVITDKIEKNKPLNEFTAVSARTFSVEETQKFAAAVNDPARMASSFAGVISTDDGNNNISIRGNSPNGLLWRMEGVEIPNPNHFSNVGTSGGGISMLSAQVITNSDFMTGAFPAEYGNAVSGVFDLKLRKGNNQKHEYTFQAGLLGLDAAAEGPFAKDYKGSYLVNYRYSTLSLLNKVGVDVGFGETNFQDVSYNITLPAGRYGNISVFGFGGISDQKFNAVKDSSKWEFNDDRYSFNFNMFTGATGIIHTIPLSSSAFLRTTLSGYITEKVYEDQRMMDDYNSMPFSYMNFTQNKISLTSILTKKVNSQLSFKTGVTASKLFYSLLDKGMELPLYQRKINIDQRGSDYTLEAFTQWNYHFTEKISWIGGLHAMTLTGNHTGAIEPRSSLKYELAPNQSVSLGYGLHSQMQPIGVYYSRLPMTDGTYTEPNRHLKFTKAHHLVLTYDRSLTEWMHIKSEIYYQYLFHVPEGLVASQNLSMLNNDAGFETAPMVNKGVGKNYGLELTVEQFMHKDFYYLLSASLYNSQFKGTDGLWHSTRYNGMYSGSFTAGKDIQTGKGFGNRIIGFNIKTLYSGGLRETPIDLQASMQKGETVYQDAHPFTIRKKDYFRTDIKFSVKRNRKKSTITWSLDIQNVTNRKNVYGNYFDPLSGRVRTIYQASLIPVLSYKIDF